MRSVIQRFRVEVFDLSYVFLDQILVYSTFSTKLLFASIFSTTKKTTKKRFRTCSTPFRYISIFLIKNGYSLTVPTFSTNKKLSRLTIDCGCSKLLKMLLFKTSTFQTHLYNIFLLLRSFFSCASKKIRQIL